MVGFLGVAVLLKRRAFCFRQLVGAYQRAGAPHHPAAGSERPQAMAQNAEPTSEGGFRQGLRLGLGPGREDREMLKAAPGSAGQGMPGPPGEGEAGGWLPKRYAVFEGYATAEEGLAARLRSVCIAIASLLAAGQHGPRQVFPVEIAFRQHTQHVHDNQRQADIG